ncbi:MAG: M42 family metallopeptidase [Candidatus Bathyarchaeia archaeon]
MKNDSLEFLRKFTEAFGPAGFEREVVGMARDYAGPYSDQILYDKLGSIIFRRGGKAPRPRLLLTGHVDEIGFVISGIDKETGFLSFNPLGGWFDQVLLSSRVIVRTKKGDLLGVIAAKPPHLLPKEEAEKVVKIDKMFIDIGASSGDEAKEMGVRIGDPAVPWSPFQTIKGGRLAIGKAFDDRVGAFAILEALREVKERSIDHPNDLFCAATVQEEVGLRGASTVPHLVDPDAAIVVDVDISGDVPGIRAEEAPARMGKGPSILAYDPSMIPNQPFKEFAISVAEECGIPYQISQSPRGGTDAGRIHIYKTGCPSLVIGIPTRHIHSRASIMSLDDLENAIRFLIELIKRLDEPTVRSFTAL